MANSQKSIPKNEALKFLLAGKSEFTMVSNKTNNRITYKLIKKESKRDKGKYIYWLSTKSGNNYVYDGVVYYDDNNNVFRFSKGKKGNTNSNEINIKAILYVINKLHRGIYDIEVDIYHVGRCGRCGKKLTTPESIITGLGPVCAKLVGMPRAVVK